jgi:sigma-B regulation protein RsbU (phosphoserine phosphatase)
MAPLVVRGSIIEEMAHGSMALGFMADATYLEQQVELSPGDVLVVYSDGVTEAVNTAGDFFGDDRLRAAIQETFGRPVSVIGARILDVLEAFVGEAPPHDDVSLVVLKRQG